MSSRTAVELISSPETFGIPEGMLLRLDEDAGHRQLPYLDLIPGSWSVGAAELLPDAVLETNGRAVVYLIADSPTRNLTGNQTALHRLRETLACRGDARYLGVIKPGVLDVYPLGFFDKRTLGEARQIYLDGGSALHDFITGRTDVQSAADKVWLDAYLLELLRSTAKSLKALGGLNDGQVLSLVGRGLFTRFIADRRIITDADAGSISGHAGSLDGLFGSSAAAATTFAWLDKTFNGNLLPLLSGDAHTPDAYGAFFAEFGDRCAQVICDQLGNIMARAAHGQRPLPWQRIQFAHVPADTLSQVYEHFAHEYWREFAAETSIHYTPRHIAQMLVDAAFTGLRMDDVSHAHVLDPAAGAGVFLVLAFKRLIAERWRATGKRPTRRTIRAILNHQLCGLDINAEALKFAALSLYLTALELDPRPTPLSELKFDRLDETGTLVDISHDGLVQVGKKSPKTIQLGSLAPALTLPGKRRFDIVVGNPPWTRLGQTAARPLSDLVRGIARRQGIAEEAAATLQVDGGIPDIPFVWRALEWARPGGMIAFALHAQHLLFQHDALADLRQALLQCLEVTGILNGSAVRKTHVWPTVTVPFCLLVARNEKPKRDSAFYYLSPELEPTLNREGRMRLDPHAAIPVAQSVAQRSPHLFKILFRGTPLDHSIFEKIAGHPAVKPLKAYWESLGLHCGDGYQKASQAHDPGFLRGMKMLEMDRVPGFEVDIDKLRNFDIPGLHSVRREEIYRAPLVLLRESPKYERQQWGGLLCRNDLAYSESFIGFSAKDHTDGEALARYLQLLSYSTIYLYVLLMTSSKFGVERDATLNEDFYRFPIIVFESLTPKQRHIVASLSARLIAGENPWGDIDTFFMSLYGLTAADGQAICDTLAMALPFTETIAHAEHPADGAIVAAFAAEVARIVEPFARTRGHSCVACPELALDGEHWRFVRIEFRRQAGSRAAIDLAATDLARALADRFWAAQIRVHPATDAGTLIIGQLTENRYWTKTRARILALDLLDGGLSGYCDGRRR
ncbi:MAG: N-6 DNA methylase [Sulfuritalea sp.]|nr:N-6 DNA methylase [Sulfuritalea sp.]